MNQKEFKKDKIISNSAWLLIIIVAIFSTTYLYFWRQLQRVEYGQINNYQNLLLEDVVSSSTKNKIISDLKSLQLNGKYGDWPLSDVDLSQERSNPFVEKTQNNIHE